MMMPHRYYDSWDGEWHEVEDWVWDPTSDKFKETWNTEWKAGWPRRCKTSKIVVHNEQEMREHKRNHICISHFRTVPPWGAYDSDHWEDVT